MPRFGIWSLKLKPRNWPLEDRFFFSLHLVQILDLVLHMHTFSFCNMISCVQNIEHEYWNTVKDLPIVQLPPPKCILSCFEYSKVFETQTERVTLTLTLLYVILVMPNYLDHWLWSRIFFTFKTSSDCSGCLRLLSPELWTSLYLKTWVGCKYLNSPDH